MLFNYKALFIITLSTSLTLSGCSKRTETIAEEIRKIKEAPPLPIPPSPVNAPPPAYIYSAQLLRSPFMAPSLAKDINQMGEKEIMPDFLRPKQELELYPLELLVMKGTITQAGKPLYALILTPDGKIVRVSVGNYMGKDYGRITEINSREIKVLEIVPNGADGYLERPRTLVIVGAGA